MYMKNEDMNGEIRSNDGYMNKEIDDHRTDFGKEIRYKTCDGKEVATMEEVMLYNKMFYERMMIKKDQGYSENKGGMHR